VPGTWTYSTAPSNTVRSGVRIESANSLAMVSAPPDPSPRGSRHRRQLLGVRDRFVDRAAHVERLLGQLVQLAAHQHLEAAHRVLELDVLPGPAGEGLGDEERLRQELLDPARPLDDQLVLLRELVHAED